MLTGDDIEEVTLLEEHLAAEFEMKNLGQLRYFLGNKVTRSAHKIYITTKICV